MNFFYKYQKPILITGFILTVLLFGYLIYILFFKPSLPTTTPEEKTGTTTTSVLPSAQEGKGQIVDTGSESGLPEDQQGGLPASPVARGGLTQTQTLIDQPVSGVTLAKDGQNLQYYNKADGKFYKIDKDGNATLLSDKVFYEVENVTWSSNKNEAILEYPDGSNIYYDFSTDKQVTMPSHWENFDFSPDGNNIVMKSIGQDTENRWLAIANKDGTNAKKIEQLGDYADTVYSSWSPNNQSIAMYTEGVDFDKQEVYFVGLNQENFKSTAIEGRGFEPEWSPKGDKLLYSVYSSSSDLKPELWVVNAQGDNIGTGRKKLDVQTWADKCTFSSNSEVYCAVPKQLEEGAGLFSSLAESTTDNLYKIDVQTGAKKLIAVPEGDYNISSITLSGNGYYLYFTDKTSNTLHKIKLK